MFSGWAETVKPISSAERRTGSSSSSTISGLLSSRSDGKGSETARPRLLATSLPPATVKARMAISLGSASILGVWRKLNSEGQSTLKRFWIKSSRLCILLNKMSREGKLSAALKRAIPSVTSVTMSSLRPIVSTPSIRPRRTRTKISSSRLTWMRIEVVGVPSCILR